MAAERVTGPWLSREPETDSRELDYLLDCVREEECVRDLRFNGLAAGEESLRLLAAVQCRFVNCSFQSCSFEQSSFVDTVFQSCDFSNCDFSDSFFNRCEFRNCKGLGTKFAGSTVKNLTLAGCAMDFANFDACRLERVCVSDSRLKGAVFSQCRAKDVYWDRVNLTGASFFRTPLRGMDFTTSQIGSLVLSDGCEELRGLTVDLYQAAELSKRLGLMIK